MGSAPPSRSQTLHFLTPPPLLLALCPHGCKGAANTPAIFPASRMDSPNCLFLRVVRKAKNPAVPPDFPVRLILQRLLPDHLSCSGGWDSKQGQNSSLLGGGGGGEGSSLNGSSRPPTHILERDAGRTQLLWLQEFLGIFSSLWRKVGLYDFIFRCHLINNLLICRDCAVRLQGQCSSVLMNYVFITRGQHRKRLDA